MTLAQKLVRLRKKQGMSQDDLAAELQVSRQAVSRWEVGNTVPSTENLQCLSRLYGVSVDDLLDDERGLTEEAIPSQAENHKTAREHKQQKRSVILIVLAALLVFSLIVGVLVIRRRNKVEEIGLGEISGEEVDRIPQSGFDITW